MPGPAPTQRPSATNNPRYAFVQGVAAATGLRVDVVSAWVQAESGSSPSGAYGGFNFLNLSAKGARGWSGVPIAGSYASSGGSGSFAKFGSVADAVTETSWWITNMGNYAGIRQAAGKPATVQLGAIARSPWDAGHYGGQGQNLVGAYRTVSKNPIGDFVGGVAGDVAHPVRTIQHAQDALLGGVMHAVLDVVLLVAGLGLIFMGVRRLSGDRLPSAGDVARLTGDAAKAAAAA